MLFRFGLIFLILINCTFFSIFAASFDIPKTSELKNGDLLFQEFNSPLSKAIESVTPTYHGLQFSHIGIYCQGNGENPVVIEAFDGVTATNISVFMGRYSKNSLIIIGRLHKKYQNLIPKALVFAQKQVGLPYNSSFDINSTTSYYCAQLVYAAFKYANDGKEVFKLNNMTFKSKGSNTYMPEWKSYFEKLHLPIPEGNLGINPDSILCSDKIEVMQYVGPMPLDK